MSVVVVLLAALISLAHCRIMSGVTFRSSSKVDGTCHGDTVEFDGNLRIRQNGTGRVIFDVGTPVDSTATLAFQTDGNMVITNPRDGAIWNAGFSNTSRGPYIGELQVDLPPTLPPTPLPTPLPTPSPTPSLQQPATPSSTVTSTNSTVLTPVQTTVPTTMTSRSVVQVESTTISTMAPSNSTATTTVMTVVATTTSEDNSALIGGIVGGIVALLLIVGVIAFFVARSRRNSAGNFHPANRDDDSLASAPAPSSSTYGAIGTDGIKVGNYANSTMVTASEQSDGGTPRDQYLGLSKVNNNNNNDYIGLRQVASPKPAPYGDLEKK